MNKKTIIKSDRTYFSYLETGLVIHTENATGF